MQLVGLIVFCLLAALCFYGAGFQHASAKRKPPPEGVLGRFVASITAACVFAFVGYVVMHFYQNDHVRGRPLSISHLEDGDYRVVHQMPDGRGNRLALIQPLSGGTPVYYALNNDGLVADCFYVTRNNCELWLSSMACPITSP